ncbi:MULTISPECIES: HD domain-containing phosphohydrolase [unclassified Thermoanaerobacterium]|uniref:HD-GYP domain-containing protein n=1 Tax=unclassified Thermoanaerobacterium TaxID=2622527 RepID=UPI000A15A5D1|nr:MULTISPECIES: HD domain-containing phosphohydrolase [unclassified Thermoanaerobacterium]MDE4542555.1 HD domain-containing protein [Thermoanaerobacterium sp. R66]ORX24544.1 phosphohydrolase [Thermoanaerobacterium sp. PSU-2]
MNYDEEKLMSHLLMSLKNYHYETYKHSIRVAKLSYNVANMMRLNIKEKITIYKGALLHDIGKVMIPISILAKPDKLTELEYDVMKLHPKYGADILEALTPLAYLTSTVLYHHERLDGTGYPYGLKIIPFGAQIVAVCDSFDAMTNDRQYRKAKNAIEAIQDLKECDAKYNQMLVSALENLVKTKTQILEKENRESNGIAI